MDFFPIFALALLAIALANEEPIAHTLYGTVKGTATLSRHGRTFYSFRGIPYAKPPLDDLRFKAPQPPDPWKDLHDAQKDAPACIQKNYLFGKSSVEGSEDCLYINVYTPTLSKKEHFQQLRLPVMVFIHWGGFFTGYSDSSYLGPEYFMDEDVVLVTFNYRLGVLGFLSTYDDASPGNYGLKDQVAALQWVHDNIKNFGGDKNKVTLFGQSAGGASVHFHMFNPISKKLFQQGISESGTALALWAKPLAEQQWAIAQSQGAIVGCITPTNNSYHLVKCLRTIDAKKLVESGDKFKFFSIDPLTVYVPSIEKETPDNPTPFLVKDPIEYIQNGEFHRVPWILGTVSDEGIIRVAPLLSQNQTRKNLNEKFNELMPKLTALVMSTPKEKIPLVWEKIRDYYFEGQNSVDINNAQSIQGFIDLYTDRSFAYTTFQTALLHSQIGHDPIWLYNFKYRGEYSYREHFAATKENINYNWGVSHCDELLYLFKSPAIFSNLSNDNDVNVSTNLVRLWTNFATYGDPTPHSHAKERWRKIENLPSNGQINKNLHFLNIIGSCERRDSIQFTMENGFYKESFKFWENLPLVENIVELDQKHIEL